MDGNYIVENGIVCHGFGGIDGFTVTNSIEALEKSYQKGKRFFETDISLTSDKKVVLAHSWKRHEYGVRYINNAYVPRPSYAYFKEMKIGTCFHVMDFADLVEWLVQHEDVNVFLDVKECNYQDAVLVAKIIKKNVYENNVENRIVISCRTEEMVEGFRSVNRWLYLHVLLSDNILQNTFEEFFCFCKKNNITSISIKQDEVTPERIKKIKEHHIKIYSYMVESSYEAYKYINMGVDFLISDSLDCKIFELLKKGSAFGIRVTRKKGKLFVEWNQVQGAKYYSLYRINVSSLEEVCLERETKQTEYFDKKVIGNTIYEYYAVAHYCKEQYLSTDKCMGMILTKVKDLRIEGDILCWEDDDMAEGYTIKRKVDDNEFEVAKTVMAPCKEYRIDKHLGTSVQYKVQAFVVRNDVRIYSGYCTPITMEWRDYELFKI